MTDHLKNFCTPPFLPLTDYDKKALAETEHISLNFEEQSLNCYTFGKGKTIILTHGWGSRASHLVLIGKAIANAGFKVVLFDAPAHSSNEASGRKETSSMFEYCRALKTVADKFGPVYGIVGHSLGAISSVFDSAGYGMMADYKIHPEKLALLSMPVSMNILLRSFSKQHDMNENEYKELKLGLENEFNFKTDDYEADLALKNIDQPILLIHDEDDEQIPFENIHTLKEKFPSITLMTSKGYGHDKILLNRKMIFEIVKFLKK